MILTKIFTFLGLGMWVILGLIIFINALNNDKFQKGILSLYEHNRFIRFFLILIPFGPVVFIGLPILILIFLGIKWIIHDIIYIFITAASSDKDLKLIDKAIERKKRNLKKKYINLYSQKRRIYDREKG